MISLSGCKSTAQIETAVPPPSATLLSRINVASTNSRFATAVGESLFDAEGKVLRAKDMSGTTTMSIDFPDTITRLEPCGKNILVFFEGGLVQCYNSTGETIWNYTLSSNFIDVYTDVNGNSLFEYNNDVLGSYIEIITVEGKQLEKSSFHNSYVSSFQSKGNDFIISLIDISLQTVGSKVVSINSKGEIKWAINFDEEIITAISSLDRNTLLVTTESNLYKVKSDKDNKEKISMETKILGFSHNSKFSTIITQKRSNEYLQILNSSLKVEKEVSIAISPKLVKSSNSYIALADTDTIYIYDSLGALLFTHHAIADIKSVEFLREDILIICSNAGLDKLQINK